MPVVNSVKQVLRMQDGEPVQAFKGKVKEVFKRRSGTSNGGRDWTVQNIICTEGEAKIEIVLWNAEMIRADREGSIIYIEAESGEEDGVIANDNEWKGKTKRQLKCSKFTIAWGESAIRGEETDPEGEPQKPADPRQNKATSNGSISLSEAKFFTARCANGMILAMRAAMHVGKTVETESKLVFPPEWIQRAVFEIYGSMERAGMFHAMPVKPIDGPKPAYEPGPDDQPNRGTKAAEAEFPEEDLPSKKPEPATTSLANDDDVPF